MDFEPKSFLLRDGRTAALRAPRREDAAEMNRYLRICSGETDFLLRTPEECVESEEQEAAYLEKVLADPDTLMIVCEVCGEIAGSCYIGFGVRRKTSHRGRIGIGLYRKFWGLGIGTRLFAEMESAARVRGGRIREAGHSGNGPVRGGRHRPARQPGPGNGHAGICAIRGVFGRGR